MTRLDIELAAAWESGLRPISTPEHSRKYFSGWVSGGWGRSVLVRVHSLLALF